jgi:sulfide:quinone oxidoreductase
VNVRAHEPGAPFRVLIAGGGVAALEAALALRHLAEERVAIELLSPEPYFWYRPLSVLEPFEAGEVHGVELIELARACGALVTLGALDSVEVGSHLARTCAGQELEYDALLVAVGARPVSAVDGALTFRGPADTQRLRSLLVEIAAGAVRRLVFAVPGGVTWPLPLYELALQTAVFITTNELSGPELLLVTPEQVPLWLFGSEASAAVSELLAARGITFRGDTYPVSFDGRTLTLRPEGSVPADHVVALPRLEGPMIAGLPHDERGFIPIDRHGRVRGADDVFAAGDAADFPIKQGGLAAQQADAAAEAIAAAAGADLAPRPFDPVLRGLLLTGAEPRFLRAGLAGGRGATSTAQPDALWWPPAKIVGRYLAPFLAKRAGITLTAPTGDSMHVDLHLSHDNSLSSSIQ